MPKAPTPRRPMRCRSVRRMRSGGLPGVAAPPWARDDGLLQAVWPAAAWPDAKRALAGGEASPLPWAAPPDCPCMCPGTDVGGDQEREPKGWPPGAMGFLGTGAAAVACAKVLGAAGAARTAAGGLPEPGAAGVREPPFGGSAASLANSVVGGAGVTVPAKAGLSPDRASSARAAGAATIGSCGLGCGGAVCCVCKHCAVAATLVGEDCARETFCGEDACLTGEAAGEAFLRRP
mmetsp:Transcript_76359/g.200352  ORF Transcript_76359/g.200352 Transcript_76359/m.200352 type:complete len:234 (+) Transcript_76359:251-952(+)